MEKVHTEHVLPVKPRWISFYMVHYSFIVICIVRDIQTECLEDESGCMGHGMRTRNRSGRVLPPCSHSQLWRSCPGSGAGACWLCGQTEGESAINSFTTSPP